MTEIHFIWAEDLDGWIGKNNRLPWHSSADLRHFRQLTTGHPIVMGHNTYDSIGRPLPNRQNIVLTHSRIAVPNVTAVPNIEGLKALLAGLNEPVYVIGGSGIFHQLMPWAAVLDRTIINGHYHGDVKMPPVDYSRWHLLKRQPIIKAGTNEAECWFEIWRLDVKKN